MKRRRFLETSAAAVAPSLGLMAAEPEKELIIDIHQHVNFKNRPNDVLVRHQRKMGVSKTVLLSAGRPVETKATDFGKSNGLAADVAGNEATAQLASEYPDEFIYYACEVPGLDSTKSELEKWLKRGAKGVGEQKFAIDCDAREMRLIYDIAREFEVPVILHFQHGRYNYGFERFHRILKAYPTVNFFGHAQTWWGNIDAKHDQAVMYPKGKVTPGGLSDRYLADYPNMFGDMSAGSGRNALTRDLDHAAEFLYRHQDKLCFATDCADTEGEGAKCSGSQTRDVVRELVPNPVVRAKIFSGNALRVIRGLG